VAATQLRVCQPGDAVVVIGAAPAGGRWVAVARGPPEARTNDPPAT
jgi:hypothetical protein